MQAEQEKRGVANVQGSVMPFLFLLCTANGFLWAAFDSHPSEGRVGTAAAVLVTSHLPGVFCTQKASKNVIRWEGALAGLNSWGFQFGF